MSYVYCDLSIGYIHCDDYSYIQMEVGCIVNITKHVCKDNCKNKIMFDARNMICQRDSGHSPQHVCFNWLQSIEVYQ